MSKVQAPPPDVADFKVFERALWLMEHRDLAKAAADPTARWEIHQLDFLGRADTLIRDLKARQLWVWQLR